MTNRSVLSRMAVLAFTVFALLPSNSPAGEATFRVFWGSITDVGADGSILFPKQVQYPNGTTSPEFNAFDLQFDQFGNGTVATELSSDGSVVAGYGITNTSQHYQALHIYSVESTSGCDSTR